MTKETAMKILKELHGKSLFAERTALETLIPELAESEDEKIKKDIIRIFKGELNYTSKEDINKYIAWLEKQDNTDLEFFENSENEKREFVGYGFLKCKGDFLSFKEGENYWLEYVGKDNYNVRSDNLLGQTFHITPQQLYTVFRPTTWLEKQGEQKPTEWSKEDENRFQNIIACIEDCYNEKDAQDLIRWFKSLRHQPKQVWSKDDEEMTEDLIKGCISAEKAHHFVHTSKEIVDWLKSLKNRLSWKPSEEQLIELRNVISGCSFEISELVELEKQLKAL